MAKTWLITGSSKGFGKQLAQLVAKTPNTNLVATARHIEDLAYLAQYDQTQILTVKLDVTKQDEITQAVAQAKQKFGMVDVLVNNAGLGYFGTLEESDLATIRQLFEVNVFGLANVTKAVLPLMRVQKSGLIINISSVLGVTTLPTLGWYSATKYAVEGYSSALRQEVADLGIQVMVAEPSGARTQWNAGQTAPVTLPDYFKFTEMVSQAAAGVTDAPGDPHQIAQLIFDAATKDSSVPKQLPLGQFATSAIQKSLTETLAAVHHLQSISVQADRPAE